MPKSRPKKKKSPSNLPAVIFREHTHCGYPQEDGSMCLHLLGEGTIHQGSGYCREHDGLPMVRRPKSALNTVKSPKFRALQRRVAANTDDPLDLRGELDSMRVLVINFLDNHPDLEHLEDIEAASELLDKVGKMVERTHKMKMSEMVSMETLKLIHTKMAEVVLRVVKDEAMIARIQAGWDRIRITGSDVRKTDAPRVNEEEIEEAEVVNE